jgi:hypothetical protein
MLMAVVALGCGTSSGDESRPSAGDPFGKGLRLRDVTNPGLDARPGPGATVRCSALSIVHVDTFDETKDGKSLGTIYLQDVGSQEPYSGIGTYGATFIPANLRVAPGDVLDFRGQYQENANIGTAKFPDGQFLPQLFRPTGTFRFEGMPVEPTVIDVNDLADYTKGRRWIGMLVTVKDVTVESLVTDEKGRVSGRVLPSLTASTPAITNELYDLREGAFPAKTKFSSVTGIVTYFFSLHIAPRSSADLVP